MTDGAPTSSSHPAPAPESLADAFTSASREDWLGLVEKTLKGADFNKRLVAKTADGVRVEPIYARGDELDGIASPGTAPYTRGTQAKVEGLGWQIHQLITESDPQAANKQLLQELEAGANGIVVQVAAPGQPGVAIASSADFVTALTGAYLDYAPIVLNAGVGGIDTARHFLSALDSLDIDASKVLGHLNLDPLGHWSRWGYLPDSLDAALKETIALAGEARAKAPKLRTIHVDATIAHEAGASEGQELAVLAATFVAYLKAFEDAGVAPQDAIPQIAFTLAVDDDLFTSLAKLRAARRLICRIAEASGADEAIPSLHITARTSERMLAKRDPWTNILRGTVACAAAAFAGVNAITVHPFTWALGRPDAFARRLARNTQIICQEESSLGRIVDPAGGAWYVEKLTDDLAKAAWQKFQAIEAQGGLVAALKRGALQKDIAETRTARQNAIAHREQELTGVSAYPVLGNDGVKFEAWPETAAPAGTAEIEPLTPHRLAEDFERLRDEADALGKKNGKPPQIFLANIGKIIDHNMRSMWTKNFLAAGGIDGLNNNGFETIDALIEAYKESGARAACICSSDALYQEHAVDAAKQLKAAGAEMILLAGKPGNLKSDLEAAGVTGFLHVGIDAVQTLSALLKKAAPHS